QILNKHEKGSLLFLSYIIIVCALCYYNSSALHLPDIRFIPFVHYIVCVWGFAFLGLFRFNKFFEASLAIVGYLSALLILSFYPSDAKNWAIWNYQGFENAPAYETFAQINEFVKGNVNDPRVIYENNELINSMGTMRAFESLPYFSGRSTLEGLYFQSSLLSPAVFYLQSLYSRDISCPLPEFPCSTLNLDRAFKYLKLLNVNQMIMLTDVAKTLIKNYPDKYEFQKQIDNFEIWKIKNESNYVEVLKEFPTYIPDSDFRFKFYNWLRTYDEGKRFLYTIPTKFNFIYNFSNLPKIDEATPAKSIDNCKVETNLSNEEITFHTNCLGQPHLVKVAYNPGWNVYGAKGPYLISPALMLVIPDNENVTLKYENLEAKGLGYYISLFGVLFLITFIALSIKNPSLISNLINSLNNPGLNLYSYIIFLFALSYFLLHVGIKTITPDFQKQFLINESLYTAKNYKAAEEGFIKMLKKWPEEPHLDKIYYFLGLSYYLESRWQEAIDTFLKIIEFGDSINTAPAYYHIAICQLNLQKFPEAERNFRYIIENINDPNYKKYATDRLAEMKINGQILQ
ncbi:MAG: hypothetical protein KBC84_11095, partial [Proteobacteria bacterium]|nr:hypothetical protein [Pseudomonadota bacterium]